MNPLETLQSDIDNQAYSAGTTIFREGAPGDYMYIVIEGEVDIIARGQVIRTVGKGDLVGEMALIDDSPRSADVVAKTDCLLAPVDERRFLFLVHETPMFALQVMSVLAERLRNHLP